MSKQKISFAKKLLQKKYREEEGKFIIEGWKAIEEALNANAAIESIFYDPRRMDNDRLLHRIKKSGVELIPTTAKEIASISDAVTSQGAVGILPKLSSLSQLAAILHKESGLIVAVEHMGDPGNLGTIIRACDWFGVDAVVVGEQSVDVYNPKVVRATMGSIFHLPVTENTDLVSFFKKCKHEGFSIYSTELSESKDIRAMQWAKKSILVIGNESRGVTGEVSTLADHRVMIPLFGKAESLNAALACGIILSYIKLTKL